MNTNARSAILAFITFPDRIWFVDNIRMKNVLVLVRCGNNILHYKVLCGGE
jgi:hypothetical protein